MQRFPFRISGIASRLGRIVPCAEWADSVRVPNRKRKDAFLSGDDVTRILGIKSKSWDPTLFRDFNVIPQTAAAALESAEVAPDDIDLAVVLTCTPYEIMLDQDAFRLARVLGLRDSVMPIQLGAGCAGLARAAAIAAGTKAQRLLVVCYNVPSLFLIMPDGTVNPHYLDNATHPLGDALWASPAVFSDGCAAVVFERSDERDSRHASLCTYSRDARAFAGGGGFAGPLVTYQGGGAWHPPGSPEAAARACYAMIGSDVKEYYIQGMLLNHAALIDARPRYASEMARIYVHQANPRLIDAFVMAADIDRDKVPSMVATYGNLVSPSTLRLLHEDVANRRVHPGDEIAFLVVGAGPERGVLTCRSNIRQAPPP